MKQRPVSIDFLHAFDLARTYFPELDNAHLSLIAREHPMVHFMNSIPVVNSLVKPKEKRQYIVFLNYNSYGAFLDTLSEQAKIGWLGHELEHVVEYELLSTPQIVSFGAKYFFSDSFKREVEQDKNTKLVARGLESEIIAGVHETLNSSLVSQSYKERIINSYLPAVDSFKPYIHFFDAPYKLVQ